MTILVCSPVIHLSSPPPPHTHHTHTHTHHTHHTTHPYSVPEPVYLLEGLLRVNMSHNLIKELSSLIDTWEKLVTLDVSFNQITALHVKAAKCYHKYKSSSICSQEPELVTRADICTRTSTLRSLAELVQELTSTKELSII